MFVVYVGPKRFGQFSWYENAVTEARYRARTLGWPMAQVVHEPTGNLANIEPLPVVWAESYDRDLSVFDPTAAVWG